MRNLEYWDLTVRQTIQIMEHPTRFFPKFDLPIANLHQMLQLQLLSSYPGYSQAVIMSA